MVISWFGLSCFKISSGDLTVVTDPFAKTVGLIPPRLRTDIAIISDLKKDTANNLESLGGEATFIIDGPGEFDVKGLFVQGIACLPTTIYAIRMEDIKLGFLGSLKQKELTDEQLEGLNEVDILLLPVGGKTVLDAEEAIRILNQIEPRIAIPMHYAQPGLKISLGKLDHFLKEIGAGGRAQEKLTIRKSELSDKASETVVLAPQR